MTEVTITEPGGPFKTRAILVDGKPAGWIRSPQSRYLVNIYAAKFSSKGLFPGSETSYQVAKTLKEAKKIVTDYYSGNAAGAE